MPSLQLRNATLEDAPAALDVVRRSITELCAYEYRHDPLILARWLANKTIENFMRWISDPARAVCVATDDGRVVAVGMVTNEGNVQLNYVAPEARFRGVSKAVMGHLESHLRARGVREVTLLSSQVARQFYRSIGYQEGREVESKFGTVGGIEMTKVL
jgi:ribosomal protein S18 acetylase RimI-like enzyme